MSYYVENGTIWLPEDDLRIETLWSDFKCFNVKNFYISALVGIVKVTLRSARYNNKDT